MNWITRTYAHTLDLYPQRFRQRFSAEMYSVFSTCLDEAVSRGFGSTALFILKEWFELPLSIISQHWLAFTSGEGQLAVPGSLEAGHDTAVISLGSPPSSSWGQSFLGGLPHILIGLMMGVPQLFIAAGILPADIADNELYPVIVLACGGLFYLVTLSRARRRTWPRWMASWSLYWLIAVYAVIFLAGSLTGQADSWLSSNNVFIMIIFPLSSAYLLYRFARWDRLAGVLASLPIMLLIWLPFLEQNPFWKNPEGLIGSAYLIAWLLGGLLAVVILRLNRLDLALGLALAVTALVGLYHSYIGTYHGGMLPFTEPGPSPVAALMAFFPFFNVCSALLLGPQLARLVRDVGLAAGQAGKWSYHLTLLGIFSMILGILLNSYGGFSIRWAVASMDLPSIWLVMAGLLLFAAAYAFLSLAAIKSGRILPSWHLFQLFWLLPGVPAFLLINHPDNFIQLPSWANLLIIFYEIAWIPLSIWLVLAIPKHLARSK